MKLSLKAVVCKGSNVSRGQLKIAQSPGSSRICVACKMDNICGFAGPQSYLETVERYRQALTEGFDVCLLACPAAKKATLALVRRKGDQISSFPATKETLGDIEHICHWADLFHVNANLAA